ncbi:MAG: hypothetical protein ABW006_09525 [Hyphomicrobium sp.]
MTAFFRPLIIAATTIALLSAVSSADAAPQMSKPPSAAVSTQIMNVSDRYDGPYRHHYRGGRNEVHAPFTRVRSGRKTVVDAPFAHVSSGRHGTHVVAPFVDLWR